jgi:hypothetical protein
MVSPIGLVRRDRPSDGTRSIRAVIGRDPVPGGARRAEKAPIVVVLAALGSMIGTFLGGILLAVAEAASSAAFGGPYGEVVGLVIILVILVTRPEGLFGRS